MGGLSIIPVESSEVIVLESLAELDNTVTAEIEDHNSVSILQHISILSPHFSGAGQAFFHCNKIMRSGNSGTGILELLANQQGINAIRRCKSA